MSTKEKFAIAIILTVWLYGTVRLSIWSHKEAEEWRAEIEQAQRDLKEANRNIIEMQRKLNESDPGIFHHDHVTVYREGKP